MKVPVCCLLFACSLAGCTPAAQIVEPYPSEIRERHRSIAGPRNEDGVKVDQKIRDIQGQVRELKTKLPPPQEEEADR